MLINLPVSQVTYTYCSPNPNSCTFGETRTVLGASFWFLFSSHFSHSVSYAQRDSRIPVPLVATHHPLHFIITSSTDNRVYEYNQQPFFAGSFPYFISFHFTCCCFVILISLGVSNNLCAKQTIYFDNLYEFKFNAVFLCSSLDKWMSRIMFILIARFVTNSS